MHHHDFGLELDGYIEREDKFVEQDVEVCVLRLIRGWMRVENIEMDTTYAHEKQFCTQLLHNFFMEHEGADTFSCTCGVAMRDACLAGAIADSRSRSTISYRRSQIHQRDRG